MCSEALLCGENSGEKVGCDSTVLDEVFRGGANYEVVEAEGMDLEGGGHVTTSC